MTLANGFPCDGPPIAAHEVAGERAILEEFERGAVFNGVAELAAPVGVTEGGEFMCFRRRGRSGVSVYASMSWWWVELV